MIKYENDFFKVYEYYMEDNVKDTAYYVYSYHYFDGKKVLVKRKYAMTLVEIIMKGDKLYEKIL